MAIDYTPWETQKWLPGVLNKKQMEDLIHCDFIKHPNGEEGFDIGLSALDLHITDEIYTLKNGTIKPVKNEGFQKIISSYCDKINPQQDGGFNLEKGRSYIIKIKESFNPHNAKASQIYAQATAKSTIGRLDVIARLIVDGMGEYESMEPSYVKSGEMYLEVTPNTFNIKVFEDDSLSQIRFFYGKIENCIIKGEFLNHILIIKNSDGSQSGTLSVDITQEQIVKASAFVANGEKIEETYIEIKDKKEFYVPKEYWKPVQIENVLNPIQTVLVEQNKFYILRSKERISLPGGVAVYCKAMDETIGELRIHYAGFVHPFFGFKRKDNQAGTPLIFEVRGHNINVNLTDGEILARLVFYRMSLDAIEPAGQEDYNNQELNLSKVFKRWDEI